MTLQELLVYFNENKTIGENKEAVDMMRHYSREAQKITMQINTVFHEPEEMVKLFSELTGKEVDGCSSWAYTKLGHIDQAQEEMEKLLGQEDVEIQLEWKE